MIATIAEQLALGLRFALYMIGLAVTVIVVGSVVDWAAGRLVGDTE